MARQSAIPTGVGLVFIDEEINSASALPGVFFDAAAFITAAAAMDGVASMAGAGSLVISGAAYMDGVAAVAATGALILFGAAHMDGVASVAATGATTVGHVGIGEMDGYASVAATGMTIVTVAGQMDGHAQVAATGAMVVHITGQMDGRAAMIAAMPLGATVGELDGVGDLEATGSLILPPPIIMELNDSLQFLAVNPAPLLTYHLYMTQGVRTADIFTRVSIKFLRTLVQNVNLHDSRIWNYVLKLRETIAIHFSVSTHTSYKYDFIEPLHVRPTILPFWNAIINLVQGLSIHPATTPKFIWGRALSEMLEISASMTSIGTYKKALTQLFNIPQAFTVKRALTLSEHINLISSSFLSYSLKLLQNLLVASSSSPLLHYHLTLIGRMIVTDIIGHYHFASMLLSQAFNIHPVLTRQYVADGSMAQLLTLHPSLNNKLILRLVGNIQLSPEQLVSMIYRGDELLDGVEITALYVSPSGTTTTWVVNTRTAAVTEYMNYNFRSFAKMGDRYIAAGKEGLYELDGDTDDGDLIISSMMSGYLQLNDKKLFGLKGAYVAMRGGGRFYLKLIAGDGREYIYELKAQPNLMTTKVRIGKGINTTYMAFELVTEGQDFDLDSIEFIPMTRERRV